jgi:hypothetical protein
MIGKISRKYMADKAERRRKEREREAKLRIEQAKADLEKLIMKRRRVA